MASAKLWGYGGRFSVLNTEEKEQKPGLNLRQCWINEILVSSTHPGCRSKIPNPGCARVGHHDCGTSPRSLTPFFELEGMSRQKSTLGVYSSDSYVLTKFLSGIASLLLLQGTYLHKHCGEFMGHSLQSPFSDETCPVCLIVWQNGI